MVIPALSQASTAKPAKPHRESRKADSHEIEALEAQWRSALITGNAASLDKLLADDFLGISSAGTVSDKQQYLHRIATHLNHFEAVDLLELKVRVQGTSAVATSKVHAVGTIEGRPLNGIFRYTKVYGRNAAGQWRVLNFEATRVSRAGLNDDDMKLGVPLNDAAPVYNGR